MGSALETARERLGTIDDVGKAGALLAWDERTKMPHAGADARAEQLATLARIGHELLITDELAEILEQAADDLGSDDPDSDDARIVRVARRDAAKARRVPTELRAEMARASSKGEQAWVKAREASDFEAFLPALEHNIGLVRDYIECFEPYDHPYDVLLDDYEPGMRTAELEPVLTSLRDGLRPLLDRIAEAEPPDASCLHGDFPLPGQRELGDRIVAALPIAADERRLDETVHPFAVSIAPTDLRITTRYEPSYIGTAVWSVIHECGHAMYENGIRADLARTPVGGGASLGFHESQSRLWENWVGRSRPFLAYALPMLRELFPGPFDGVDADQLYRAANRVEPSLIRVEADEATYNFHIILRFELEVAIFTGELSPDDLPEAWNTRMRDYLGVEVPDDAQGVLQDVHWGGGIFGYFPTYSLGNVIAGQLWDLAGADLPDLTEQIGHGEFMPLRDWLRQTLHTHGAKFEPAELIQKLTGGGLDAAPLLRQLETKYDEVYELA